MADCRRAHNHEHEQESQQEEGDHPAHTCKQEPLIVRKAQHEEAAQLLCGCLSVALRLCHVLSLRSHCTLWYMRRSWKFLAWMRQPPRRKSCGRKGKFLGLGSGERHSILKPFFGFGEVGRLNRPTAEPQAHALASSWCLSAPLARRQYY
jgi:hypothetical protein